MAKEKNQSREQSPVPVLIGPREEAVVDGSQVTFSWNPVEGVREYRVQVSSDASFEDIILDRTTGDRTHLEVSDAFALDEETYYWRVLARGSDGRVHGEDNVETFISGTATDRASLIESPDQEEEYGPAERLFKGAAVEAAAEVTGAETYEEEEAELGVEHEGVEAGQILGLTLAIAAALALSIVALFQYFNITAQTTRNAAAGISGYPELRENRFESMRKLSEYGVLAGESDRYRIPIERAMELMANETHRNQEGLSYSAELPLLPEDRAAARRR